MKKIYYLSSCDTCRKIIKDLGGLKGFIRQDIKTESISESQLNEMKRLSGSFEALFSRRALKYREYNLGEKELSDSDYKHWILKEYTFLKRPVIICGDKIFIGSDKKTITLAHKIIHIK